MGKKYVIRTKKGNVPFGGRMYCAKVNYKVDEKVALAIQRDKTYSKLFVVTPTDGDVESKETVPKTHIDALDKVDGMKVEAGVAYIGTITDKEVLAFLAEHAQYKTTRRAARSRLTDLRKKIINAKVEPKADPKADPKAEPKKSKESEKLGK
jgi:hypothetical protein